jgi:hypothetical protein
MRIILGILSGLLGALAGWFGLAFLIVILSGPDRDGGIAMGAFFNIGPIGGLVGFVAGIWLFSKIGIVRNGAALPDADQSGAAPRRQTRISRPFAVAVLVIAGGLGWWAWYELIRSPYLTHGFMTLDLQFRLPAGMNLPSSSDDAQITVEEGDGLAIVTLGERWHGHDGDLAVILATADLDKKTSHRVVRLDLPGIPEQIWRLDLGYDPDPTPGFSAWQLPNGTSGGKIEMNYRLRTD